MVNITRQQLQEAIAAGINNARWRITDEQREALLRLGETATRLAVGRFYSKKYECGCPLYEALDMKSDSVWLDDGAASSTAAFAFSFCDGYDGFFRYNAGIVGEVVQVTS